MVAELVGAFNDITERMGSLSNTFSSSQLLFKSLKLSIPLLQAAEFAPDGRDRLSRALAVATLLADLQVIDDSLFISFFSFSPFATLQFFNITHGRFFCYNFRYISV